MYHACARHGARHTGKRNVAMETTMATLNQYPRRGVGRFVRSFVCSFARSAGRSVTQAKSPRGPIGHVRERSSLFPLPSTSPAARLFPPLPRPPSLTRISPVIPPSAPRARMVFSFDVFPSADMPAFGMTGAAMGRNVLCASSQGASRHVRGIARGERGRERIHKVRDPCPIGNALCVNV